MSAKQSSEFGWLNFRPSALQCFNSPKWLLVAMSLYSVSISMVTNGMFSVSVSTIEKRFSLTSSTMGVITSMYDIASLLVVIFVGYYGGRQNKSLWLGCSLMVIALGAFIFITPHMIIGPYQPGKELSLFPALCQANVTNGSRNDSACHSLTGAGQWYYTLLLCMGMLVIGFGGSPLYVLGVAYLDESVKNKVSSLYIGIFAGALVVGAALGFGLGGVFLSINVDIDSNMSISRDDSRWIGNWWLGFVVLIVASLLLCPWMAGFPPVLAGVVGNEPWVAREVELSQDDTTTEHAIHSRPSKPSNIIDATKTLFTSPSFLFISFGISFEYFDVSSCLAFAPKVVQFLFNLQPSEVSLLYGVAVIFPLLFGQLLGSYLVKKLKLGPEGILKLICVVVAAGALVSFGYFFTHCPDNPGILDEVEKIKNSTFQSTNDCDIPCNCDQWPYYPVCDGNTTFISPCHAGCTSYSKTEKTFQGCMCTTSHNSTAKPGKCSTHCNGKAALFLIIVAITGLLSFLTQTPCLIAILRSVPYDLRAYAMAWQLSISRIFGSIPGPIVFGKLIDNVCNRWEKTCKGTGRCMEYHNWNLVLTTAVMFLTVKVITFIFFALGWKTLPKKSKSVEIIPTCATDHPNPSSETAN